MMSGDLESESPLVGRVGDVEGEEGGGEVAEDEGHHRHGQEEEQGALRVEGVLLPSLPVQLHHTHPTRSGVPHVSAACGGREGLGVALAGGGAADEGAVVGGPVAEGLDEAGVEEDEEEDGQEAAAHLPQHQVDAEPALFLQCPCLDGMGPLGCDAGGWMEWRRLADLEDGAPDDIVGVRGCVVKEVLLDALGGVEEGGGGGDGGEDVAGPRLGPVLEAVAQDGVADGDVALHLQPTRSRRRQLGGERGGDSEGDDGEGVGGDEGVDEGDADVGLVPHPRQAVLSQSPLFPLWPAAGGGKEGTGAGCSVSSRMKGRRAAMAARSAAAMALR